MKCSHHVAFNYDSTFYRRPLTAGVLYNPGILLSPAPGAVLMTVSTVVVAINASMLKVK